MSRSKQTLQLPTLTKENSLKTLVENRTVYNLDNCELNLFETYQKSELVPLKFNDLVVTSMLRGKKVMHLFEDPAFEYVPGESVIVPANIEMVIDFPEATFNKPTQCLALAIDNEKIVSTLNFLNEKYPKVGESNYWKLNEQNYFFDNNEELATTINKLINICQSTNVAKDVLADITLQELLVRIIQTQTLNSISTEEVKIENSQLKHVVHTIRKNISDKLSLKNIANTAGLSMATMYRMFKRELGISPVEFVIIERIKHAKNLLKDQNLYIKNVSYESGFVDTNYFIRTFKHYEGITPKQYQQIQNKTLED